MSISSKKTLLSLATAAVVVLSAAAVTPAQARGGFLQASPTVKFMARVDAKTHVTTPEQAARQTAAAPSFNDTSGAAVVIHDLAPSGNGIARRLTLPN